MIFMSVVVGVMIVDWPDGEPSSIVIEIPGAAGEPSWRVDDIPEQVVRDLLDENGYIVSPNQCTAKITEEHRGGYGGYYFDETDRAVAYAYPFGSRRLYAPTTRNLQGEHGAECREAVTHLGFDPNRAEYWENIALPEYGKTVGEIKLWQAVIIERDMVNATEEEHVAARKAPPGELRPNAVIVWHDRDLERRCQSALRWE